MRGVGQGGKEDGEECMDHSVHKNRDPVVWSGFLLLPATALSGQRASTVWQSLGSEGPS